MLRTFFWILSLATLGAELVSAQAAPSQAGAPQDSGSRFDVQAWTWEQVKDRLELNNPTLLAEKLNIDECRHRRSRRICGQIRS